MKKTSLILIIAIFIVQQSSFAQNTLWLSNGKKIQIGDFNLENSELVLYKNKKGKTKSVDRYDVFSIIESSNNEIIIYKKDSSYEDAFNLAEMKAFVEGQYDASLNFKSPLTTVGGIVVSGAAAVVVNPIYVLLVSGAYTTTIGLTKPIKSDLTIPEKYSGNKYYELGYNKAVKKKRVRNAIIGSVIGLAAGFTTFVVVNQ